MRSSIFSSKRWRRQIAHLAFGAWAAGALIVASALLRPAAAVSADIVTHKKPPATGDFYLAHHRGGHIDHHVLYHGIDTRAREHMRAAEVLFLGNSRLMFALDPEVMRRELGGSGVKYYVLGFGHEEQDDFPLRIIRANDLRPKLVVVNADHFFAAEQSDWAARVIDESDFDAWKVRFEGEITHRVRGVLHRVVPQYVDIQRGQREVVLYRSREDGTWFVANHFARGVSFEWPPNDDAAPDAATLAAASAFKRELEARGARLVLCLIPAPNASLHRAQIIAAHLDVPLVVPPVATLRTIDGSHLSAESIAVVAPRLLAALRPYLP